MAVDIVALAKQFREEIALHCILAGRQKWTWEHYVACDLTMGEITDICNLAGCWARDVPGGTRFYVNQNHSSWR